MPIDLQLLEKAPENWGWKPDKPDERDFRFATIRTIDLTKAPKKIDLRTHMTPVEDQGWTSSCVANASVGSLEYLYSKRLGKRWSCFRKDPRDYSRMFVYWYARKLDGFEQEDGGCYIRTAMKAMQKFGVCQEKYWEFKPKNIFRPPNDEAQDRANRRKVVNYYRITSVDETICALAEQRPVIFGALLYESFMDPNNNGIIPLPDVANEKFIGGHAMLAVGYDLDQAYFIIRNSWGTDWGLKGYCKMPFDYFKPIGHQVSDCWVIKAHPDD